MFVFFSHLQGIFLSFDLKRLVAIIMLYAFATLNLSLVLTEIKDFGGSKIFFNQLFGFCLESFCEFLTLSLLHRSLGSKLN